MSDGIISGIDAADGSILWVANGYTKFFRPIPDGDAMIAPFSPSSARDVRASHSSEDELSPTPLVRLASLAEHIGVGEIYVKDESKRARLGAMNVLGCSYALSKLEAAPHHIITASAGAMGMALAHCAKKMGARITVAVPDDAPREAVDAMREEGAEIAQCDGDINDAVQTARELAESDGLTLMLESSPHDDPFVRRYMMGLCTSFDEAAEQLDSCGAEPPTHIFVQDGGGAFAAAAAAYFKQRYTTRRPKIVVVEARSADCLYRSAAAGDGRPRPASASGRTAMHEFACAEPDVSSYDILRGLGDIFISCPDSVAVRGVKMLAAPLPGDEPIVSSESGAVCVGLLARIATEPMLSPLKIAAGLSSRSRVLLFNTDGRADSAGYRRIVWG